MNQLEIDNLISNCYDEYDRKILEKNIKRGLIIDTRCPCCKKLPTMVKGVTSTTEHPVISLSHEAYGVCNVLGWHCRVLPFSSMKEKDVGVLN